MTRLSVHLGSRSVPAILGVWLGMVVVSGLILAAQSRVNVVIEAYKYGYRVAGSDKGDIRVHLADLVHVTFSAEDIPHSFTIDDDHYRISRRAEPGKPVTFEFRADKPGTFEIYCNLSDDPRCRRDT